MFKQFSDIILISLCLVYPGLCFHLSLMVISTVFHNYGSCSKNGPQIPRICNEELTVRVCFRFGVFLHEGIKDPNVCLSSAPLNCQSSSNWVMLWQFTWAENLLWCFWGTGLAELSPLLHWKTQTENRYSKEGSKLTNGMSEPSAGQQNQVPDTELERSDNYNNTRYEFQKVQTNSFCLIYTK